MSAKNDFFGGLELAPYQINVQLEFAKMVHIADNAKKAGWSKLFKNFV